MSAEITTQIRHANKTMLLFVVYGILAQIALLFVSNFLTLSPEIATVLVMAIFILGYFVLTRRSFHDTLHTYPISFKSFLTVSVIAAATLFLITPLFAWLGQYLNPVDFTTEEFFLDILKTNGAVQFILIGAVVIPVIEEMVFRGILLNGYRHTSTVVTVIVTALFFTLAHVALDQMVYVFAVGIVLGLIALITNSLLASIWAHMLFNGISSIGAVLALTFIPETFENLQAVSPEEQISSLPGLLVAFVIGVAIIYLAFRYLIQLHNFTFKWDRHRFLDGYLVTAMLISVGMGVLFIVLSTL